MTKKIHLDLAQAEQWYWLSAAMQSLLQFRRTWSQAANTCHVLQKQILSIEFASGGAMQTLLRGTAPPFLPGSAEVGVRDQQQGLAAAQMDPLY